MIDHILKPVSDYEVSKKFYSELLAPLGYKLLRDYPEKRRAGFGIIDKDGQRDFWIVEDPGETRGSNYCTAFKATDKQQVDDFYEKGLAAGGKGNGAPGYRDGYSSGYYAAFVFDPDGYNIEAVFDDIEN